MANKLEKLENNPPSSIIEKGHIYFLYRPKVTLDHAEKIDDVQKLVIVLSPGLVKKNMAKTNLDAESNTTTDNKDEVQTTKKETTSEAIEENAKETKASEASEDTNQPSKNNKRKAPSDPKEIVNHELPKYRSIVIAKKQLPDVKKKERIWGYVNKTAFSMQELQDVLDKDHYKTATMGERTVETCRPIGEGIYAIVNHERHTHLVYILQFPNEIGEIQKEFNIVKEGSYIVSVKWPFSYFTKNPEAENPRNLGLPEEEKKGFPENLQQRFKGRKWAPLDTTDFLEHESCEMVFIGATDKVHHEDTEVEEYLREAVKIDKLHWDKQDEGEEVKIIKKLKLSKETPTESLFGKWT